MNITHSIYDWELFHQLNKTSTKQKFYYKMSAYIPKNDSDDLNPNYLFQLVATDLLVAIVHRQIDSVELAHRELKNRGLDDDGKWVGFNK